MDDFFLKHPHIFSSLLKIRHRLTALGLTGLGLSKIPAIKHINSSLQKCVQAQKQILVSCQGNKFYLHSKDAGIVPYLVFNGVYERRTTDLFKSLLKPGMVVLDVGANFGYYSVIASRLVQGKGRVYALEPEPDNYSLLVKNIAANRCANVAPFQIALSSENGKANLFLDRKNLGLHSFHQNNVTTEGGTVEIETMTLDYFVQNKIEANRVDLIKMDVQGAEGLVIKGAEETLGANDVKVVMEMWPRGLRNLGTDPQELVRKLTNLGLAITLIDEGGAESEDFLKLIQTLESRPNKEAAVNVFLERSQAFEVVASPGNKCT